MLSPSSSVLPTNSPIFLLSAPVRVTCAGPTGGTTLRIPPRRKKALTRLEVELLFATSQLLLSEVMSYAVLGGGRGLLGHEERPGGVWPLAMGAWRRRQGGDGAYAHEDLAGGMAAGGLAGPGAGGGA